MNHFESHKNFLTKAAEKYNSLLPDSEAEEYLAKRGIDLRAADTSLLGFVPREGMEPGHEQYRGMLSIPYVTKTGVVALKFRMIDDRPSGSRYLWPAGQKSHLYNAAAALTSYEPYVVLCEGELDTCVAHYVCGVNSVGIAGVSHWKAHHPRILRGFPEVFVVADNDDKEDGTNPGQDLARRILNDIPHARNVLLPRGMDITDYVLAHGEDAFPSLLGLNKPLETVEMDE